jgi:tellurite resistance protein TerC
VLKNAEWSRYLISGFLVLAALRMLIIRQENMDPLRNPVIRVLRKFIPISERAGGSDLVTREGGRLALTPLLLLVLLLETADAFMALDSIPAVLAITREPLLVFSANAFALLCLRSLYMALSGLTNWLRYVKIGLACSLGYAAVLMSLPAKVRPDEVESIIVLLMSVAAGLIIGMGTKPTAETVSPLGEEADQFAKATLRQARKVIGLVVGITVVLVGILLVILPGPGLPVVFIGLAILGNEFAWAKRFLDATRQKAEQAVAASTEAARKRLRPWILIPLGLGTIGAFVGVGLWFSLKPTGVLLGLIPALLGQWLWGYLAFYRKPRAEALAQERGTDVGGAPPGVS